MQRRTILWNINTRQMKPEEEPQFRLALKHLITEMVKRRLAPQQEGESNEQQLTRKQEMPRPIPLQH